MKKKIHDIDARRKLLAGDCAVLGILVLATWLVIVFSLIVILPIVDVQNEKIIISVSALFAIGGMSFAAASVVRYIILNREQIYREDMN